MKVAFIKTICTIPLVVTCLYSSSVSADSANKTGFYVVGSVGYSNVQSHQHSYTQDAFKDLTGDDGSKYSGDKASWTIPSKKSGAVNFGLIAGYNLKQKLAVPIRTEIEYRFVNNANLNSKDGKFDFYGQMTDAEGNTGPFERHGGIASLNKIKMHSLFANVWFDIDGISDTIVPYIGAGIGYSRISNRSIVGGKEGGEWGLLPAESVKKNNFSWQLGTGVAFSMTENLKLDLGYRFVNYGKIQRNARETPVAPIMADSLKLRSHNVNLGLRYEF